MQMGVLDGIDLNESLRPLKIDSDYNFPWNSIARAHQPMESNI